MKTKKRQWQRAKWEHCRCTCVTEQPCSPVTSSPFHFYNCISGLAHTHAVATGGSIAQLNVFSFPFLRRLCKVEPGRAGTTPTNPTLGQPTLPPDHWHLYSSLVTFDTGLRELKLLTLDRKRGSDGWAEEQRRRQTEGREGKERLTGGLGWPRLHTGNSGSGSVRNRCEIKPVLYNTKCVRVFLPLKPPSSKAVARILFCPAHSYSSKPRPFSPSMSAESSSPNAPSRWHINTHKYRDTLIIFVLQISTTFSTWFYWWKTVQISTARFTCTIPRSAVISSHIAGKRQQDINCTKNSNVFAVAIIKSIPPGNGARKCQKLCFIWLYKPRANMLQLLYKDLYKEKICIGS